MSLTPEQHDAPVAGRTYRQKWLATITHHVDCFGKELTTPIVYSWECYSYALPHVAESHALHNARTQWAYGRKWPNQITITPMFDDPDGCDLMIEGPEPLAAVRSTYGMVSA
jgi:hypothetical protein